MTIHEPTGLERLWAQLALPVDPAVAAEVLAGVPHANARQLLAVGLATCPEVDALLDRAQSALRSLSVATNAFPIRCVGEIRGPVLWSETMAARSASPGAGGVFICASPAKAYDTDENRVFVAALRAVLAAADGSVLHEPGPFPPRSTALEHAHANGERARHALEHRALASVARTSPNGRMLQKTRSGTKAQVFRHAVEVLQRSRMAIGPADLTPFVDPPTARAHVLAADVADDLRAQGRLQGPLRVTEHGLVGGPFSYCHPGGTGPPGVVVDGVPVSG